MLKEDYEMSVYRVEGDLGTDGKIVIAREISFEAEAHLEQLFENSPFGLNQDEYIFWIGKQPHVKLGDKAIIPDMIGIDSEGNLVIVEFKRKKAPDKVISQLFEYAAWAAVECSEADIISIAEAYFLGRDGITSKFHDRFRDEFDIPDESELPNLNQRLRLFVVAEEIPDVVSRVCRWQRTSHGLDITCIEVSLFQTESNETYIDMEVKVGEEDIDATPYPNSQRRTPKPTGRDIVYKIVKQLTGEDKSSTWTINEVFQKVLEKHQNWEKYSVTGPVLAGTVNSDARSFYPGAEDRYWRVKRGVYKLYDPQNDPQTDKEKSEKVNTAE